MKNILQFLIDKFGYSIIKSSIYQELLNTPSFVKLWNKLENSEKELIAPYLHLNKSQYSQDLFVISQLNKRTIPNYFVEFGATDGVNLSNTFLLEKYFHWNGILCEPAKVFHSMISKNRNCHIDKRCVYDESGLHVEFCETQDPNEFHKISSPELSTIKKYLNSNDWAQAIRKGNSNNYEVETVSLNDLLSHYNAPKEIGYLSIDTEGSELDILLNFNFQEYKVFIISVEHNSNISKRNQINELLTQKGYKRVFDDIFGEDDIYMLE
jgi:FkbM family methyltransferase